MATEKVIFNGYNITNVVLYSDRRIDVGIGIVSCNVNGSGMLEQEVINFLKYLKVKYS